MQLDWTSLPVTDEQLRAAGFTSHARQFPHSEAGARWVAEFNGIPFDKIPAAWCYASNQIMWDYVEKKAAEARARDAAAHKERER